MTKFTFSFGSVPTSRSDKKKNSRGKAKRVAQGHDSTLERHDGR